jgi:hypothetical protein
MLRRPPWRATGLALLLLGVGCTRPPQLQPPCSAQGCDKMVCGQSDCGTVCATGSGCRAPSTTVEGGLTHGAALATGGAHAVQGTVTSGAAQAQNAFHRVEQGQIR